MSKLAGIKFEKNVKGEVKKVIMDMKRHAAFIENYLDHLRIEEAKKSAEFVDWDIVRDELDKKHGINPENLQSHLRP